MYFKFSARKLCDMNREDVEGITDPVFGFKRDLIQLVGNLCHSNKQNQDLVSFGTLILGNRWAGNCGPLPEIFPSALRRC